MCPEAISTTTSDGPLSWLYGTLLCLVPVLLINERTLTLTQVPFDPAGLKCNRQRLVAWGLPYHTHGCSEAFY